jgi:hypothetical protein
MELGALSLKVIFGAFSCAAWSLLSDLHLGSDISDSLIAASISDSDKSI